MAPLVGNHSTINPAWRFPVPHLRDIYRAAQRAIRAFKPLNGALKSLNVRAMARRTLPSTFQRLLDVNRTIIKEMAHRALGNFL